MEDPAMEDSSRGGPSCFPVLTLIPPLWNYHIYLFFPFESVSMQIPAAGGQGLQLFCSWLPLTSLAPAPSSLCLLLWLCLDFSANIPSA